MKCLNTVPSAKQREIATKQAVNGSKSLSHCQRQALHGDFVSE
jgi:hypothetical protein